MSVVSLMSLEKTIFFSDFFCDFKLSLSIRND